jgi:hypothetical protein
MWFLITGTKLSSKPHYFTINFEGLIMIFYVFLNHGSSKNNKVG